MINSISSIHEVFNAKNLSTSELCNSFITNSFYNQMCSSNNSILIGPRGSGKTTLMRMLSSDSLSNWNTEESLKYKNKITFSGIFIPTDRFWKDQYEAILSKNSSPLIKELLDSIFIYHVLEKTTLSLISRLPRYNKNQPFNPIDLPIEEEANLVTELSVEWRITPNIPSIKSLSSALVRKKREISEFIDSVIRGNIDSNFKFIKQDISSVISSTVTLLNTYIGNNDERWCFLFDELELAPNEIVDMLFNSMRITPENCIFKLALCPYHDNNNFSHKYDSAMRGQDYNLVDLSPIKSTDENAIDFSNKVAMQIFSKNNFPNDPSTYFEEHSLAKRRKDNFSDDILKLYDIDPSLRNYLEKQKIKKENIETSKESDKRSILRKIRPVALVRSEFFKKNSLNNSLKKRSRRRSSEIYSGFYNICKSVEYNPRMLISIINSSLEILNEKGKISATDQISLIENFYDSYISLLRTIPLKEQIKIGGFKIKNIAEFVEYIGRTFESEMVSNDFKPEPKGSFIIDERTSLEIEKVIGESLNVGAIIITETRLTSSQGLKGVRCRLSFIFSHKYWLLLTLQREKKASSLFEKEAKATQLELL